MALGSIAIGFSLSYHRHRLVFGYMFMSEKWLGLTSYLNPC